MILLYRLIILSLIGFVFCIQYGISITDPPPYNDDFVSNLNNIPTVENISFDLTEINELKTSTVKSNTMIKYKKKMTGIKCIYGDVLKNVITKMKDTKNKSEFIAIVKESKVYLSQMLSVLFMGKTSVANWLWDLFLLLEGVENNPKDREIFLSKIDSIEKSIGIFLSKCLSKKYLLNNYSIQKDTPPTLKAVDDVVAILKSSDNNNVIKNAQQQFAERFEVSNIVMDKLKDNLNAIRPTAVTEEDVWNSIADKLNAAWKKPLESWYDNHYTIIENQYDLIANIVKMGVIYNVWMHLRILHNNRSKLSSSQQNSKESLLRYWRNLLESLIKARQALGTLWEDNQFLKDLVATLNETDVVKLETLKTLMDSAKKEFYDTFKATYGLKATNDKMTLLEKNAESIRIEDNIAIPENALQYKIDLFNYSSVILEKIDLKLMQFYKLSKSNDWMNNFEINS